MSARTTLCACRGLRVEAAEAAARPVCIVERHQSVQAACLQAAALRRSLSSRPTHAQARDNQTP